MATAAHVAQPDESTGRRRWTWRIRPEGWLCALLFVWALLASVASRANLMILLAALVAGMFIVGAMAPLFGARHLKLRVDLPERVFATQPALINVELRNPSRWWGASGKGVRLAVEPRALRPLARHFWWIPPMGTARWSRSVVFDRRGEYYWLPPVIVNTYPFGFAEYCRVPAHQSHRRRLVVYPPLGQLNTQFFEQQLGVRLTQTMTTPDQTSREQEFRGLREYREGDSARWIHWPTTARKGTLMVREFEIPQHNRILLVLVPWLAEPADQAARTNVELAVSLTATALYELSRRPHTRVALLIVGEVPQVYGHTGENPSLATALEALALVRPVAQPDFQAAADTLRRVAGPGVQVSVVTTAAAHSIPGFQRLLGGRMARNGVLQLNVADRNALFTYFVPPAILLSATGSEDENRSG